MYIVSLSGGGRMRSSAACLLAVGFRARLRDWGSCWPILLTKVGARLGVESGRRMESVVRGSDVAELDRIVGRGWFGLGMT